MTVAAVRERFGTEALYGIAALSGLTDVDAITLSTAEMVKTGRIDAALGWRLVLVASLSNLAFKGAMATFLGGRRLGLLIGLLFGLSIALGMALLVGWDKLAVRGWPVFGP